MIHGCVFHCCLWGCVYSIVVAEDVCNPLLLRIYAIHCCCWGHVYFMISVFHSCWGCVYSVVLAKDVSNPLLLLRTYVFYDMCFPLLFLMICVAGDVYITELLLGMCVFFDMCNSIFHCCCWGCVYSFVFAADVCISLLSMMHVFHCSIVVAEDACISLTLGLFGRRVIVVTCVCLSVRLSVCLFPSSSLTQ